MGKKDGGEYVRDFFKKNGVYMYIDTSCSM